MARWEDIHDRETLKAWLVGRPREVAAAIAARAALRVMPLWAEFCVTDAARKRDLTPLPVLRSCLISSVAAVSPTDEIRAASAAASASAAFADAAYASAAFAAADAAAYAAAADASYAAAAADASYAAYADAASYAAANAVWTAVQNDCAALRDTGLSAPVPLWHEGQGPFQSEWITLKRSLPRSPAGARDETARAPVAEDWTFWIKWYDAALEGRPLNPAMLEEIALIPESAWKKGPAVVNPLIAVIEEKYRLREELAALEVKTAEAIGEIEALPPRSHNRPPELVDEAHDALSNLKEMQSAVKTAREEVEAPAPDTKRLAKAGKVIARVGLALLKYCGEKADIVVTEAAKKIGAGIGIAAVSIAIIAATSGTLGPAIQDFAAKWSATHTSAAGPPVAPQPGTTLAP